MPYALALLKLDMVGVLQSLWHVGLYLPRPVFTHGQLYVAVSRVKSKKGLKVLVTDKDGKILISTRKSLKIYKNLIS